MSASARNIGALALASAERRPDDVAVRGPDGELSYGALAQLSGRIARALGELGVKPGDRVGVRMPKSARAVAALQGVVRAGAVYVPVDPIAPAARARMVLDDCAVSAIVGDAGARALASASDAPSVPLLCLDDDGVASLAALPASVPHDMSARAGGDLAYILYTSGSTGKPKGVCLSHDNALAFVDWAVRAVDARASDRFASHAPFHFDLSVLDLYGAFSVGARVCLIPEGAAYIAPALVDFMVREEISLWYSVPSALMLMMEQAALLETRPASLRTVIFAGEPFPIKPLRALRRAWPSVALWNFYGPTETNVCTAARIDRIHDDDTAVPIGAVASGDRAWARMDDGAVAGEGQEGELVVDGPTVFLGYFGAAPQRGPYGTGDIVKVGKDGSYEYVGRRDHMVKVRGVRVELGDIEHALGEHALVREAAVVVHGSGLHARVVAFLVVVEDAKAPTLLDIKRHCAERLPRAMIPDDVRVLPALPRTGNGKVDRRALLASIDDDGLMNRGGRA